VPEYSIGELAAESGVTHRTIRYYVEIGLLPPPEGAGRAATYSDEHLARLQLIKRMQSARLSLDEIREQLAHTKPGAEPDFLVGEPPALRESASEYLAWLRDKDDPPRQASHLSRLASAFSAGLGRDAEERTERGESFVAEPWTRIPLAPDAELHVRRRGHRTDPRIARLIKEARRIWKEEEPK
jgi:DNA-binding transcriptional MerR regulator